MDCHIKIQFAEGQRVAIRFVSFNVEANAQCSWDWLEIRDGEAETPPDVLAKVCGNSVETIIGVENNSIESTSNTMTLVWHTDHSVTREGFVLIAEIGITYFRKMFKNLSLI